MKRTGLLIFAATALVVGGARLFGQGSQAGLGPLPITEGTLVDGRCNMINPAYTGDDHGADRKQCGLLCMKSGAPAAVLTADKQLHPLMTYAEAFADVIGQPVRVTGPVRDGAILPRKVEVTKDGQWQEVKLVQMKRP